MKNILVTGGAGFIGTNFVYSRLNKYPDDHIVVLDALTYAGRRENLSEAEKKSKFTFVHGDILDQTLVEYLLETHDIDAIVHFAAESHVDRSISGPDQFIKTNINGTHILLKAAKKIWSKKFLKNYRFHHISTDEVYGTLNPEDLPFTEETPYAPNSPYAASKAASDHLVRAYYKTYGLQTTISNCSNNYGPYQFPEKLIPLMILNILNGIELPVYGDGKQIRDWLHVDDHNEGVNLILDKGEPGETYNIGGSNEWSNIEIIELICEMLEDIFLGNPEFIKKFPACPLSKGENPKSLIRYVQDRLGHDRRYAINADKIKSQLGYLPTVSFRTGLRNTLNWFLRKEIEN